MFGKKSLLLLVAATCLRVTKADFMLYTEPPIPTSAIPSFANPSEAASWTTSVGLNAKLAYAQFERSLGSPYTSAQSSAASEIAAFVKTARNYTIPSQVTEADETPTFYSMPDWYTALPSRARQFKESQVADQFSIVKSVIGQGTGEAGATSTAGAVPTAKAWVGREFGVMAAAAAAAFL